MGISRICGCTTETSPVPKVREPIHMTTSGCSHGFDEWDSIKSICGVETIPLAFAVAQCVHGIKDGVAMSGNAAWMPHRDLFLFAYQEQADGGTPWAGLYVAGPNDLRIVWDPCPRNLREHHGSMDALEWAKTAIPDKGSPNAFVVVIPLN
jgi:hypothetical protein